MVELTTNIELPYLETVPVKQKGTDYRVAVCIWVKDLEVSVFKARGSELVPSLDAQRSFPRTDKRFLKERDFRSYFSPGYGLSYG